MKFDFNRPSGFREKMLENVDDGRQRPTYYKLTNEPKGSGELIKCPSDSTMAGQKGQNVLCL